MFIDWREHIAVDPAVLVGKPVVRGTRLAVEFILGLVGAGWSFEAILANHPGVTVEDIRACVACARDVVTETRMLPVPP